MALTALLRATRDYLRTQLALDGKFIGVQPDGQPPPSCGDFYYAVHPIAHENLNTDMMRGIDEQFALDVTITQRTSRIPYDRIMDEGFLKAFEGIEERADKVKVLLHENWNRPTVETSLMHLANVLITGPDKLEEALTWMGTDAVPRLVGPDWFWSSATDSSAPAGMVLAVHFGRSRRTQAIEGME